MFTVARCSGAKAAHAAYWPIVQSDVKMNMPTKSKAVLERYIEAEGKRT